MDANWPSDGRLAVVFQLILEQWSAGRVEAGRHVLASIPDGQTDHATLSWQDYGGRVGFRRLMDTTASYGVPATGVMSGLAVERFPDLATEFVARGNEIAAHSWCQDIRSFRLTRDEMQANVHKCVETIERVASYRPIGWISPGGQASPETLEILAEEGFLYSMDCADSDTPSLASSGAGDVVLQNVQFDLNDHKIYTHALRPPSDYVDMFKRSVDTLVQESLDGTPRILGSIFHSPLFGKPYGAWALRQCIEYVQSDPNVWITTRRAIAERWLAQA